MLREQTQEIRNKKWEGGWQSTDEEQWGVGTVYQSSLESANHSEGEHQLVRFFLTRGRKNERRGGQVHMKAAEINTGLSPQQ